MHPHLYSHSNSPCVECDTCKRLYTPSNFVCHSHKYESHTRHWGFDSANWRIYLKLVASSSSSSAVQLLDLNNNSKSVLNDIKIANKDNIAANGGGESGSGASGSKQRHSGLEDEFDAFKRKFLSSTGNALMMMSHAATVTANRQLTASSAGAAATGNGHHHSENQFINGSSCAQSNKRSLSELNNQLISNGGGVGHSNGHCMRSLSNSSASGESKPPSSGVSQQQQQQSNGGDCKGQKSLGEHKLLNGLLSKPLTNNQLDSTNR